MTPRDWSDTPEPYQDIPTEERKGCWTAIIAMVVVWAIIIAAALYVFLPGKARAHDAKSGWAYPVSCCSGIDCGEIPDSAVTEGPNGFEIRLLPGQHVMVKNGPAAFLVPYGTERPAPDGKNHICLSPQLKVLCFFTGSRGF